MLPLLAFAVLAHRPNPTIRIDRATVIRRFDPRRAFGVALDGHDKGEVAQMLTRSNVAAMTSMGLRSLTYRLRTELAGECWHWNPAGTWSDSARQQGYWTSSANVAGPIWLTHGYRLPRRGDSIDQADRDSYSRIDDGNPATFWKSNPYLDPAFTGESYAKNPQWIVVKFSKRLQFNELRIDWGAPYAKRYAVEYLDKDDDDDWTAAHPHIVAHAGAGPHNDRFAPFTTRYLRIALLQSSETGVAGGNDPRDRMGFAVREISAGFRSSAGAFHDFVVHTRSNATQTRIYVSSTDPWHRAKDLDRNTEQPGFDLILGLGLDQGQRVLVPAGCLYDTPKNVANEAVWLERRGVKLRGLEVGEEPDGNWMYGEQYGMLYVQMADAVRKAAPQVRLGGPSLQTASEDYVAFPRAGKPWVTRFVEYVKSRRRLSELNFFSFEWYPIDNIRADPANELERAPRSLEQALARVRKMVGNRLPIVITEFGWSSYAGSVEVHMPGALFDFDVAMTALASGCEASYQYGWEPNEPIQEVPGAWGNNMALLKVDAGTVKLPTYWSAWLLTHRLCAPSGAHSLLRTTGGNKAVGAYALRRPNGTIGLALLNRSRVRRIVSVRASANMLNGWTYGQPQYQWLTVRPGRVPNRNMPPEPVAFARSRVALAPYSITILDM
ncbi:MAG: discoidin domain-containing protein [Fimbriimonadaceae bacterium]